MHDDLGLSIFTSIPHNPTMIITYTNIQSHRPNSRQERENKNNNNGDKGKPRHLLTDAHPRQDEIVVHTTADRDKRLGLHKVDAAQSGVARL